MSISSFVVNLFSTFILLQTNIHV